MLEEVLASLRDTFKFSRLRCLFKINFTLVINRYSFASNLHGSTAGGLFGPDSFWLPEIWPSLLWLNFSPLQRLTAHIESELQRLQVLVIGDNIMVNGGMATIGHMLMLLPFKASFVDCLGFLCAKTSIAVLPRFHGLKMLHYYNYK